MSLNSWITSILGLIMLVFTSYFLVPLVRFINNIVRDLGAPQEVASTLMMEMQWGFYIMGFSLLILPFIIDNWSREETGREI